MSKQKVFFIGLTQGQQAIVDEDDFECLSKFSWQASLSTDRSGYYAIRNNGYREGTRLKVRMSREIMNAPAGLEVDHINGHTLDNRQSNLRICTHKENTWNKKKKFGKSKYRGVHKHSVNKWRARISINGKRFCLGLFDNELDAHIAYDKKARELYGEYYVP